ncbi:MAG: hypothetical protein E7363_01910 [Clostridiales bacterium]|nr:hypothetical protein [Clostridiales bacterium]
MKLAKTTQWIYSLALVGVLCILFAFAFALPAKAESQPVQPPREQILFPADFRDFFRFGEEGATAAPKYIFAGADYIIFADDDVLTLKKADGNVLTADISALSKAHEKRFSEFHTQGGTYVILSDGLSLYAINLSAPTLTPTLLLENEMALASAFTILNDSLYLKGNYLTQYALSVTAEGLTASNKHILTDSPVTTGYRGSSLFLLTAEGNVVTPSDDGTQVMAGNTSFPVSAKPLSIALKEDHLYYLGEGTNNTRAVYTINLSTGTEKLLVGLTNPSACGLAVSGNTMYVAYAHPDTTKKQFIARYTLTQEIATLSGEICAYSSRPDRLSETASAISEYEGTVFVADGKNNRIVSFDGTAYASIPLDFSPTFLSVSKDYILTGADNRIVLLKKDGSFEREITGLDEGERVKKATYASSEKFYVLVEETVQGLPYYSVSEYRLAEKQFTKDFIPADKSERVLALATDLSNHLYLLKATGVNVYDAEGKALTAVTGNFSEAYDLQVDFENNIYFLLTENRIGIVKNGETQISILYNLLLDYPYLKNESPTAFHLSFLEKPCYVLYSGFVMKTENVVLSSPVEIAVPPEVDLSAPHDGAEYVTAEVGAVFFHFDLSVDGTQNPAALGYERITAPTTYIYLGDTGAYAYVLGGQNAGFIRKEYLTDIFPEGEHTAGVGTPVTSVACNLYRYPLLFSVYQIKDENAATVTLQKNTALKITGEVTHEGITYCILSYGEGTTYLPKNLITYTTTPTASQSYTLRTVQKVYGETPVLYADKECTQKICELSDESRIRVYAVKEGVATVVLISETEDGVTTQTHGFMQEKFLVNRGSNVGVIALVILLLVVSLVLSTAYFIKRKGNLPPEDNF